MAVEPTSVGDEAVAGRAHANGALGAIVLARHGEPSLSRDVKLNAAEYAAWWARYEVLGLLPGQVAPEPLTAFAAGAGVVICSTRVRAIESAKVVCGQRVFDVDERLIEAPLPPPNWPDWLRLPPRYWGVIARTWWWFFDHHMGQETRAQADLRADQAADRLIELAGSNGDVLVVAHGFFNAMIGRALRRRGWKLVEDQGYRYWSTKRFEQRGG
jgi:broad specificity phosphatase PhoE